MKNTIIYILSIIIPALFAIITVILFAASVGVFSFFDFRYEIPIEASFIFGAITFVVYKLSTKIRVEYRQRYEMGREDKSESTAYKYKSQKERDVLDMFAYQQNEAALSEKEFRSMIKEGSKDPDKELESLTGLNNVKEKMLEIKAEMVYREKKEEHNFNMCFLGNPGTGKTTVAKILAGYLYQYKFLKENRYIVVDGNSLISSSDPGRRINLLLQRSKKKLLFIDEAYALTYSPEIGSGVLATILNEMESDRKNTIVILAGYKKEMRNLFLLNSGLESRIKDYLFFEDYNNEELLQILASILEKRNYQIRDDALLKSLDIFEEFRTSGTFANARSARNIAEASISRHKLRMLKKEIGKENEHIIDVEDIIMQETKNNYFSDVNF